MDAKEKAIRPCKRGHLDKYPNGRCRTCAIDRAIQWARDNLEKAKINWAKSNSRPEAKEASKRKYQANRQKYIDRATARNKLNPEYRSKACKEWARKNPHKRAVYNAERRLAVRLATPKWSDKNKIELIYIEAQKKTIETGIRHSVDHVLPLKHKLVCGLHVHENLAVIPYAENCRKGNRGNVCS